MSSASFYWLSSSFIEECTTIVGSNVRVRGSMYIVHVIGHHLNLLVVNFSGQGADAHFGFLVTFRRAQPNGKRA